MAEAINENVWDGWNVIVKPITFAGGTTNAIGDHDGTGDPFTIATVTGTVAVRVFGVCKTSLTVDSGATLEVGTAKSTAAIIAQTGATGIAVNEIWHDASPDNSFEFVDILSAVAKPGLLIQNIIGTVGTANITAGVIDFYVLWKPISNDSSVKPSSA